KLRRRWLKSANQLDVDELIARYEWRRRFPQLREMIDWVQALRMWFERKYEKPAREALLQLIERASQSAQEPLKRMAGTLTRWFKPRLLLDSRVVDVPMVYNPTVVTLSSWKPFFFNGLQNE